MRHLIALLCAWFTGLLAPTDPPAPIVVRPAARTWPHRPLRSAPEIFPDTEAKVRPYLVAAEQAARRAVLAEAIGAPARDWTVAIRVANERQALAASPFGAYAGFAA